MMQIGNSGREDERNNADWVALYEVPDRGSFRNPVQDLSVGGTFLRTSKPMEPGTNFDVVLISREDCSYVRVPAQVVWRGRKDRHRGMGVRFTHNRSTMREMRSLFG
jgi:Tfp pilus assembly protein PilZ